MKKGKKQSLWIGSALLAFISAAAIFIVLLQAERHALSDFEKEFVYIARTNVPRGQKIDESCFTDFFEKVEMEARYIPESAVRDIAEIKESACSWNIEKGIVLTRGMLQTADQMTEGMAEPVIAGLKAEDIYQVSGGILRSGDRIHIFGVNEDGNVTLKWSNVCIQQVFDASGKAIAASDMLTAAQRINIYMDKAEVEKLYTDLETGNLRAVKICE